jgi:hypothetical protein
MFCHAFLHVDDDQGESQHGVCAVSRLNSAAAESSRLE